MDQSVDVIITVRSTNSSGGSDVSGWVEIQSMHLGEFGNWWVRVDCGCYVTQSSWDRCREHKQLEMLCIQARLPFDVAPGEVRN